MVEFPAYFLQCLYDYFVTTLHWDQTLGKKMTVPRFASYTGCGPEKNVARLLFHRVNCAVSRETNGTERESQDVSWDICEFH